MNINGFSISAKEVSERLSKNVEVLVRYDEQFLSFAGSATLLDCGDHQVAVTTGHQIAGSDIELLGLLDVELGNIVTSNGYYFPIVGCGDSNELHDVRIFDFSESVSSGALRRDIFFPVSSENLIGSGDQISFLNIFGFAFKEQEISISDSEPYEVLAMHSKKRDMLATYLGATNDDTAFRFKYLAPIQSFDGFSGCGIFAIVKDRDLNFSAVFAGLVTRSSGSFGYGIKGEAVARIVRAAIARHASNSQLP